MIVANDVSRPDRGFAVDHNAATIVDAEGAVEVGLTGKRELAERIWDEVLRRRAR
jgi:phosphopantothenoylcysteine synthetase/decarboxylase